MTLHEPATFLTDAALAAWSAGLGWRLGAASPQSAPVRWWVRAFLVNAIAALAGGLHHGFGPEFPAATSESLWRLALLALAGTGLCLAQAAAHTAWSGPRLRRAQIVAWTLAAGFGGWALWRGEFFIAICAYGLALLSVLAAAFTGHRSHRRWIVAGVAASSAAAWVQQARLAPSPRFNHNDLYHVVQAAAHGCFFLGARALQRAAPPPR